MAHSLNTPVILRRIEWTCVECGHLGRVYVLMEDGVEVVRTTHRCGLPKDLEALQK